MIVKSEPINEKRVGFTGYRFDGKAIISGTGNLFEDHIEFKSSPVYDPVSFGCLCGAQKQVAKQPAAGPEPLT